MISRVCVATALCLAMSLAVAGANEATSVPPSAAPVVEPGGNERALCGLFSYTNTNDGVASFGTVRFDGAGAAALHLQINGVSHSGGRNTREVRAQGPYRFDRELMGTMVFDLPALNMQGARYDFVAVEMAGARPVELFGVLRNGGVNGQLVDPTMRRLRGCDGER